MSLAGIMRENKQTNSFEGWATRLGSILFAFISREGLETLRYNGRHAYDQNFFFFIYISTSKCGERGWKCNANVSRDNSMIPHLILRFFFFKRKFNMGPFEL